MAETYYRDADGNWSTEPVKGKGAVTFRLEPSYTVRDGVRYGPYGPYWYAYLWRRGRMISRYVGTGHPTDLTPEQLRYLLR